MPTLPPKACSKPHCPNMQDPNGRGYCKEHMTERPRYYPSKAKQKRDRFYDTTKWRNYRHRYLMINPMCDLCMSNQIAAEANHLDHIIPRSAGGEDFPDYQGVRGLCHSCHSRVTTQYMRNPDKYVDQVCKQYNLTKPKP